MSKLSAQEIAARKIEEILVELDRTVDISQIGGLSEGRIHIIKPGKDCGYLVTVVSQSVWDRNSTA
jgi:hypothetical protein